MDLVVARRVSHRRVGFVRERAAILVENEFIVEASQMWHDRPVFYSQHKYNHFEIQAAAFGDADNETEWFTFANGGQTLDGGTHQAAFQQALVQSVRWRPAIAAISVTMMNAKFSGPSRSWLDVPEMKNHFVDAISPDLKDFCKSHRIGKYTTI